MPQGGRYYLPSELPVDLSSLRQTCQNPQDLARGFLFGPASGHLLIWAARQHFNHPHPTLPGALSPGADRNHSNAVEP